MRKLQDTELFSKFVSDSEKKNVEHALVNKLSQSNMGVIAPEHISAELVQLKLKCKSGSTSLLGEAISLYEGYNGRIKLFNLGTASNGRSPIPTYMPFVPGMARNRSLESDKDARPTTPAIFMNMYRVGNWNANEDGYIGISAITDLYTELESGLVIYKMLINGDGNKILSNPKIIETLTRLYTFMFSKAVTRTSRSVAGSGDFMKSASEYLIAKFFLKYIVGMVQNETLEDYAYKATDGKVSFTSLRDFEASTSIEYETLSGFLRTFGSAITGEEIDLHKFQISWISTFGEGLILALEYLPYLIHYLIAVVRGSGLGGVSRLMYHKPDLNKRGLDLFYRTLITELH